MVISVVGETDTRPLLYTLMKLCQGLGDVLVVSTSSRIQILSDTRESGGFYQNCMIAYTDDGLDIFLKDFGYTLKDFNFILLDNITAGEADITFHVSGLNPSDDELELLSYLENVVEFEQYSSKNLNGVFLNLEKFEGYKMMNQINPAISSFVATKLGPLLKLDPKNLVGILNTENPAPASKKSAKKSPLAKLLKKKG